MRYPLLVLVCSIGLIGCSGGSPVTSTCEVISPPPAMGPTEKDNQRIETQSSGDPTAAQDSPEQRCP